jgi:Uncharacterized alpha/beta hydrolase domain (DUF2235)
MPKNIVICCDGTGNEFNPQSNSNVVKLCSTLVINQDQASYYHPGVGTMGAPTADSWWEKQWTRIKGLAFGGGFFEDVGRAYQYLMHNYNDHSADGRTVHDRVYLFGFSRGAYTARALASLLKMFGLLHPGNEAQIPYVLRMFERRHKENHRALLDEAKQFQEVFSPLPYSFCRSWGYGEFGGIGNRTAAATLHCPQPHHCQCAPCPVPRRAENFLSSEPVHTCHDRRRPGRRHPQSHHPGFQTSLVRGRAL